MIGLLLVRECAATYWPLGAGVSMAKRGANSEIRSTKSETNPNRAEQAMTETGPRPRSQTPVWERHSAKLLFPEAVGTSQRARNGVSRAVRSQTGVWERGKFEARYPKQIPIRQKKQCPKRPTPLVPKLRLG